jgi:hypothetical protein
MSFDPRKPYSDFPLLPAKARLETRAVLRKATKASTARTLWFPAVNNDGNFGRRAFLEISDSWDAKSTIRGALSEARLQEIA